MKYIPLILLGLATIVLLFPCYWMIIGSLQNVAGILRMPPQIIPRQGSLDNYRDILRIMTPGRAVLNTVAILFSKVILTTLISISAGYALSVYIFPGKKIVMWIIFLHFAVANELLLVPLFVIMQRLGTINTLWAVILTGLAYPLHMLLARYFIDDIPHAMFDGARLDGASEYRVLFQIVMPICKPLIGFIILVTSIAIMRNFLWPSLVLQMENTQTLMVNMIWAVQNYDKRNDMNLLGLYMAGGTMVFVPIFIIFCFCQRYFVSGLKLGGIR